MRNLFTILKTSRRWLALGLLMAVVLGAHAGVAVGDLPLIKQIEVVYIGKRTVNEAFIRSHIRLKVGDRYKVGVENDDIKALMETGRFQLVTTRIQEDPADNRVIVNFVVTCRLVITRIGIRGRDGDRFVEADNLKLSEKKLRRKLTSRIGDPYSRRKTFLDARALREYYEEKNYYQARVFRREDLRVEDGSAEIIFEIIEGEKVKIEDIRFRRALLVAEVAAEANTLTTLEDHGLKNGDPVRLHAQPHEDAGPLAQAALPGGVLSWTTYTVQVTGPRTLQLQKNQAAVDLASAGQGLLYLYGTALPGHFSEKKLGKTVTQTRERRRWYNPVTWFTGDGRLREEWVEGDIERLVELYQEAGYLDATVVALDTAARDFQSPDFLRVKNDMHEAFETLSAARSILGRAKANGDEGEIEVAERNVEMAEDAADDAEDKYDDLLDEIDLVSVVFLVEPGQRYRVGAVDIEFVERDEDGGLQIIDGEDFQPRIPPELLVERLELRPGAIFKPSMMRRDDPDVVSDVEMIENAYGARAYIMTRVLVDDTPNIATGAIDLRFRILEGDEFRIERINIEGNRKTQDLVIRRELAITPGERFDMGRVELSKQRIEGLRLFQNVRVFDQPVPELGEDSGKRNLMVSVRERNTGRFGVGAGFSTDGGAIAHTFYAQENFDLFRWKMPHPLTGAGQKLRIRAALGFQQKNYSLDFVEPWFYGRKLRFEVNLYAREYEYYSDQFDVEEIGVRFGLERTLFGTDSIRGGISHTFENAGITDVVSTASDELKGDGGKFLISKFGSHIAYDTRGGGFLPTSGQRTELASNIAGENIGGEADFYNLNLSSAWYFEGLRDGHVLELIGRTSVADNYGDSAEVPYLERYTLGGGSTLRGFSYREVGPRDSNNKVIGGETMYMGTAEYSVPTFISDRIRFASFVDAGGVARRSYDWDLGNYNANYGFGLRIEIPFLGPLRMDYGIPFKSDAYNDNSGRFNLTFGYTTAF